MKLNDSFFLFLLITLISFSACRNDFDTEPSTGKLEFSKNTVYLDTVFSGIGSSTYQLTVHNRGSKDINIPTIRLKQGEASHYRLNVDGLPGKSFQDITILAKDSIFVFVETTANISDLPTSKNNFLYTDVIQFDAGSNQQDVNLVTLIKDAVFLYPEKYTDGSTEKLIFDNGSTQDTVSGFLLNDSELQFTNEKPYVVYGLAAVPNGKTLTIDPGARVYFHSKGGIVVSKNASLHVNGEGSNDPKKQENEVIFESDRLEPNFSDVPGQWFALWLTQGSTDNQINHATIKNATIGILMDSNKGDTTPTLRIKNTQIYNCANSGLLARSGFIEGENMVINNCGQAALNISMGGKYEFTNCTFANYWNQSFSQFPSVLIENNLEANDKVFAADLVAANFYNCIIAGNDDLELLFNKSEEASFNYRFENCLIQFNDFNNAYIDSPLYDFGDATHFKQTLVNEAPIFQAPTANNLHISEESPANGLANPSKATPTDILGSSRGSNPDTGAYESIVFPEKED